MALTAGAGGIDSTNVRYPGHRMTPNTLNGGSPIWLVEDNSGHHERRASPGNVGVSGDLTVRLHKLDGGIPIELARLRYRAGHLRQTRASRSNAALKLIDQLSIRGGVLAAGSAYGTSRTFLEQLCERGLDVAMEVRPSTRLGWLSGKRSCPSKLVDAIRAEGPSRRVQGACGNVVGRFTSRRWASPSSSRATRSSSRRSSAPMAPGSLAASASVRMRRLYSAV